MNWVRSSRCHSSSCCVEVAFVRSSYCSDNACVEVGVHCGEVLVRDSKEPDGPVLRFGRDSWAAFVDAVKAGGFD